MATRRHGSAIERSTVENKRTAKKHDTPRSRHAKPGAITAVKGRALKSRRGSRPVGWALEDE